MVGIIFMCYKVEHEGYVLVLVERFHINGNITRFNLQTRVKTYLFIQYSVADLSSLTVLRTILRSHDEAQKSHGKQIHKLMEYTSRIFSFLPCKIDFQASIL